MATNELDDEKLSYKEFLTSYKNQSKTESGFKFIKNNTFEVDSIFLKNPSRISALMMVMCLCLMVYAYSQMFLRQQLDKKNETIPDQKKRPTKKPTMQWICNKFHGIHILNIKFGEIEIKKILNLTPLLRQIISYFGSIACNIYNISI